MNYKRHELINPFEIIFRLLVIGIPIVYVNFSFIANPLENFAKIIIILFGLLFCDIYFKYFSPLLWCSTFILCLNGHYNFEPMIFYVCFFVWACIYLLFIKSVYEDYKIHKANKNAKKIIISENNDIISVYKECCEVLLNIFSKVAYTSIPPYIDIIEAELHPAIYFIFTKTIENQIILDKLKDYILDQHNDTVCFKSKFYRRLELYDSLFNNSSFTKYYECCNLDNILSPLVFKNDDIKKSLMILLNIIENPNYDCIDIDMLSADSYYYSRTDFMYFNELIIKQLVSNIDLYIERAQKKL